MLEIEKILVVSTGHITWKDNERLQTMAEDSDYPVLSTDYYYLINLLYFEEEENNEGWSEDFVSLIIFSRQFRDKFTYLKLDRDGPVLDEFAVFDW